MTYEVIIDLNGQAGASDGVGPHDDLLSAKRSGIKYARKFLRDGFLIEGSYIIDEKENVIARLRADDMGSFDYLGLDDNGYEDAWISENSDPVL